MHQKSFETKKWLIRLQIKKKSPRSFSTVSGRICRSAMSVKLSENRSCLKADPTIKSFHLKGTIIQSIKEAPIEELQGH